MARELDVEEDTSSSRYRGGIVWVGWRVERRILGVWFESNGGDQSSQFCDFVKFASM